MKRMHFRQKGGLIGLYAWGGPGTIRLLRTKYHSPNIDERSFLTLYDSPALRQAKDVFGVTDMWVTYSWGFSDETEKQDRLFLKTRLRNFKKLSIRTHAYVQGLNVVTKEFHGADFFCRDIKGRILPYSKGRSLICPNSPHTRDLILKRVEAACGEEVDGVFIDNVLFGLPPFYWRRDFVSSFGCSCVFCRNSFKKAFGYSLPMKTIKDTRVLDDYRRFRAGSIAKLVRELSRSVLEEKKKFGVNLYDPYHYTPDVYFGYSLRQLLPRLSYLLVENHALDKKKMLHNTHLAPLLERQKKPVFVVSYRGGIGVDAQLSQDDFDAVWTDSQLLGYAPCYKATEYKTHGTWHAIRFSGLRRPHMRVLPSLVKTVPQNSLKTSSRAGRVGTRILGRYYARIMSYFFENRLAAEAIFKTGIYSRTLRKSRYYDQEVR